MATVDFSAEVTAPAFQQRTLPSIPVEVLREANTVDRAWVAVNDQVYDVTKFAERHPGGADIIGYAAGKDMTIAFHSYHTAKQHAILQKYLIGTLVGRDAPRFPPPDSFSIAVRARAAEYFKSHNIDPKQSTASHLRYAGTILAIVSLYIWQWQVSISSFNGLCLFYGVALLYGFSLTQYALSCVHDASHAAVGHSTKLWSVLMAGHDLLNGCSSLLWTYQHILSHHIFTNVPEYDTDVEATQGGYRRIVEVQEYMESYKLQYIYAPIMYVLLGMAVRTYDVARVIAGARGHLTVNPLTVYQTSLFWGGKVFFFFTRIGLPLIMGYPIQHVLGAFFVSDFIFSVYLALIFQATHVVEAVTWPNLDPTTGDIDMDWSRLQVETAQEYGHNRALTTFFSGALNYQAVHHLFPNVAQENLARLSPIVAQAAKEFGVRYTVTDGMWSAIGGHIGLLKMMGEPPHGLDG